MIPFDARRSPRAARRSSSTTCSSARSAPRTSRSGRTSASATRRQGDAAAAAPPTRASRRACVPLLEVDGEIVSSSHIRGLVLGRRRADADRLLGAPFQLGGEVAHGDKRGRELGFPTANLVPDDGARRARPRRLRLPRAHGRRRGRAARQRRRAPDVRDRPRRADRGLPARLRRRPLRPAAAPRVPRAPARRAALRDASRRWSSRCTATSSRRPGASSRLTLLACWPHMSTLTTERKRRSSPSSARTSRTRATPGSRSRCSPSAIRN